MTPKEEATLIFQTYDQAKEFSIAWGRETLDGYIHGNKEVIVYNIDKKRKKFIANYIDKLNKEHDNRNKTN